MSDELKKGLEDVLVAESDLSFIDGDAGKLVYCGYAIEDLARTASYEEVLYLLWHGDLPTRSELDAFRADMASHREIDDDVLALVENLAAADADPMAALRTAASALSAHDDTAGSSDPDDARESGKRITAKLPTIVAAFTRLRNGDDVVAPRDDLGHAANFLYMLNGEAPDDVLADVFDQALVLHADHGLNASTFSGMVTASTLADVHAAVTSAIGTLSGSLHGGANANVMRMLKEVDDSDKDPLSWVQDALANGERVMGFGHRVYNVKDPRARILSERSEELGAAAGDTKWYEMSVAIEDYMADEKGLAPNVDFYSASTYYQMGIPVDIYTPIFAMSRVGGWVGHVLEQYDDNRLIRPRARYVGAEDRDSTPLDER
ncbi:MULTISPECIES: citrate synthase [Halobacterium]|uniref:citrate synthase n=1 Tax=Halobacterium TaxID=2239 RepID=UPI00196446D3|nr:MULTISPECIES: citrate synthase [Halobacterium]MCF2239552.1 citrate synthase [Halobacterium salinarum]MDL0122946.1 citrate synthase [Halobacterium salinarum]MDL0134804.1 citrate synthase [Halobacterium salinarum]QRY22303.1 citrate synthase [Halobacterium sp. GSL-19]QRY24380.1 citrate synthase [Halobacterium sp. BOL4-2]